jgi:type I restriction enzyme S subunit
MNEVVLSEGWTQKTVVEMCGKPQYGFTASATSQPVGPRFLRITDIQDGIVDWSSVPYCECVEPDKYRLHKGDILFARTGATTGKTYLVTDEVDAVFASYLIRISAGKEVLPSFMNLYFQSPNYWQKIVSGIDEGNRPNMNGSKLAELTVPYPIELAEQRRIVARIEELTRRADEARRLRQDALDGVRTLFFDARRKLFQSLSLEWPTRPLVKCGKVIGGGTPSKKRNDYWGGFIPWISAKDMKRFELTDSCLQITEEGLAESSVKVIPKQSVLFVVRGSILYRYVPVSVNTMPCTINQDLKAIVPDSGINAIYLAHMLWGANDQLQSMVEEAGNTAGKLPMPAWSSLEIPVPDGPTQQAVIEELGSVQDKLADIERLQVQTAEELASFQPALLAKAFRGEL